MKNKFVFIILSFFSIFIFTGCCDDDEIIPPVKSESEKTYTLMVLGCGGGNLDAEFAKDVPLLAKSVGENVNVVCQYTSSTNLDNEIEGYKPLGTPSTTYRFKVTPDLDIENYEDFRYKSASEVPLYIDKTVTDFINYAVETSPADEYILVLYNHGNGFDVISGAMIDYLLTTRQNAHTRGVLADDNFRGTILTEKVLSKAIANSKAPHMKAIYFYACNQGMIECYSELYQQCDYIIGTAHIMSSFGEILPTFVRHLGDKQANDFEDKVLIFMKDIEPWWSEEHIGSENGTIISYNDDLSCIRTSQIERLNDLLKRICDRLCSEGFYTEHKEAIDNIHANYIYNYYIDLPSFDLINYCHLLAEKTNDRQLIMMDEEMNNLIQQLFVSRISIIKMEETPKSISEFSLGITIYNKSNWHNLSLGSVNYYTSSVFAQQTSWHRWFEKIEGNVSGWAASN